MDKSKSIAHYDSDSLLKHILQEVRLLREEVHLLLPDEDINEYVHKTRIKRSYERALKQYPPVSA